MSPWPSSALVPSSITSRSAPSSSSTTNSTDLCLQLDGGKIAISKRTLIIAGALCVLLTTLSLLAASALFYREYTRRKQAKAAKAWGRTSRLEHRISLMQKGVDTAFTRQYSGCLQHAPENPEMGSESPVELMLPERLCEAPAIPAQTVEKGKRKGKAMSLFFDQGVGMWLPKR